MARARPPSPSVLCLGGLDPTGGAGLAADVRAGVGLGMHVVPVATCIAVQDGTGVESLVPVPGPAVRAAARAGIRDRWIGAVKVGAVGRREAAEALLDLARAMPGIPWVIDPVSSASAGGTLTEPAALEIVRTALARYAAVVTPNLPELASWTGAPVADEASALRAARAVLRAGAGAVCVTGGHGADPATVRDLVVTPSSAVRIEHPRIAGTDPRGTGCTFATAVAAALARDRDPVDACVAAAAYLDAALRVAPGSPILGVPRDAHAARKRMRVSRIP